MFRTMEGGLGPPQKDIRGTGACAVGQKRVGTCSDGKKTFGQVTVGQGGRTTSCKTSIIPGGNMYTQYTCSMYDRPTLYTLQSTLYILRRGCRS